MKHRQNETTERERYDRDMGAALHLMLFIVFGLPLIAWLVVTVPGWHQ